MPSKQTVLLKDLVNEFKFEILHSSSNYDKCTISQSSINRPGLSLVDFYDYFDSSRLQILGKVEHTYLAMMSRKERLKSFRDLLSHPIPALILARSIDPFPECLQAATEYDCTVLRIDKDTGDTINDLSAWLRKFLAPHMTRHGVLMEIYGEGVLLMGDSGVGKSETAVELIKRGHRLIADDAVEIRRINSTDLVGSAPELIRYYVEMRGIGIIDVRQLFGMSAVKDSQVIDMIINIERWKDGKLYDRLGAEDTYQDVLGVQVPSLTIPVQTGRNLAVIIEVAAMNNRHKKMGYNAAQEFTDRINAHFDAQMSRDESSDMF